MPNPTDGHAAYEAASPIFGGSFYQPRLDQIAAGGFALVLNYNILVGHIADVTAYINYAASKGMKVVVALNDPAIWRDNTYATKYAQLYADAGNPSTGTAFMQYIVNQTKALAGVWGWYVADEITATDHTTLKAYSTAINTADSTHPRMVIESASDSTQSVSSGLNTFYDCATVIGDDWYPTGDTQVAWPTIGVEAAGILSYATAKSVLPAITLQCFSWSQYPPTRNNNFPNGALWPSAAEMRYNRDTALAAGTFKVMLWYTYYNLLSADDPGQHWTDLCWAANNVGSQPVAPSPLAQALFYAYVNQSGWMAGWTHATGTLETSITSGAGVLTGATDVNYFLCGSGAQRPASSRYIARVAISNAATGKVGIVFNWIDANNYMQVDAISNTTVRLVSVVAGVQTVLGSAAYTPGSATRFYLKCDDTGSSYVVKAWTDQQAIEPSTLFTVSHSATTVRPYRYGVYAQLAAATDTASVYSFAAFDLNPTVTSPVYYVATNGNDSYPGTQSLPFATIQQAANVVTPGATVHVGSGTYSSGQILTSVSGTPTARIRFIADGVVNVRTVGVATCWGCFGNYTDIVGVDISGDATASNGIVFYGAFNTAQYVTVENLIGAGSVNGIQGSTYPSSDNQLIGCVIKNISVANQAIANGVRINAPRMSVLSCLIFVTGQAVLMKDAIVATISNNLIANCNQGGVQVWGSSGTAGTATVTNNIFYGNGGYSIREIGTTNTASVYRNNLFYLNTNTTLLQNSNVAYDGMFSNPLLVNYQSNGSGVYELTSASPCINAGTSVGAASVDATAALRSLKSNVDIGPYLYYARALFPPLIRRTGLFPALIRRQS